MKKAALLALVLALAAIFAVSVSAADEEPFAFLELEGMTEITVTSSVNSTEDVSSAAFFDKLISTGAAFTVSGDNRTLSVYTATGIPKSLSAFAAYLQGETGTVIGVNVFGTNDSSLENWTTVLPAGVPSEIDGFRVFPVDDPMVGFAFYRFDFTVADGDGFILSELALYAVESDEPELVFAPLTSVEPGETLPLIPKPVYEAEIVTLSPAAPAFGVNTLRPGLRR